MRNFSVHRASISRYMSGRSAGIRRSSSSTRGYKLSGTSAFQQYLLDAKKITNEVNNTESTESTEKETSKKSSALSKYARSAENTYTKDSGSKFNGGIEAMSDAVDDIAGQLGKSEPDAEKTYDAAAKFIDGFNEMTASVRSSSNASVARKSDFINTIVKTYARSLEKVGVKADTKGVLSIDKEKFSSASAKDIENIFGKSGSFASHISEQTDSINKLSQLGASTYSGSSSNAYSSYTSSMSGSLFSRKL